MQSPEACALRSPYGFASDRPPWAMCGPRAIRRGAVDLYQDDQRVARRRNGGVSCGTPAVSASVAGIGSAGSTAWAGSWSAPFPWPVVALHLSLVPDGRVLSWGHVGTPQVWDPATAASRAWPARRCSSAPATPSSPTDGCSFPAATSPTTTGCPTKTCSPPRRRAGASRRPCGADAGIPPTPPSAPARSCSSPGATRVASPSPSRRCGRPARSRC